MQLSDRGGDARDALMPPRHVGILGQGLVEIDALADERVIVWFQFRDLEDFLRSLGKVNDLVVVVGFRRLATVICFMDLRWLFLLWVGCSAVVEEFLHPRPREISNSFFSILRREKLNDVIVDPERVERVPLFLCGRGVVVCHDAPQRGEATRWQEGLAKSEANEYKEFANFRLLHLLLAAFPTTGAAIP